MHKADRLKRFLIEARARIHPDEAGFPRLGRRRVKGLRREEVAELAGVSSVWYSRFESGRARLSMKALRAVAIALRLSQADTWQLFALAFPELPAHERNAGDSIARANAGVLRVGAVDLPMAQREMFRCLHAVAEQSFHVAQDPASWLEQDVMLEAGEVDVAISYRFDHAPHYEDFDEHVVCEEVSSKIAIAPQRLTSGRLSVHEMTGRTLSAPCGRIVNDLRHCVMHEGFTVTETKSSTTFQDFIRETLDGATFAFVTDDYAQLVAQNGLEIRDLTDIAIVSDLVFRTRKDDVNPAVHALRAAFAS